ncbi:unnamed protein product [Acanthoscelides obtectus]|uniref:Protein O-mannosyl-transferase C-terminal four TM domain-containing protein n=1 Tax=Acanthoscelides obtectus TaxID=200917 RepID=A0A9P0ME35_ACAOB|nr:unnamed protein product [Acanthoscelides obtectus]CAK1624337.1 Protein O-mannosyl-transferase 2 [Acanthoscelides obtectus]
MQRVYLETSESLLWRTRLPPDVPPGQFFSGSRYRIYLLGNPVIWWANSAFILIFLVVFITNCIKWQRGYIKSFSGSEVDRSS